LDAGRLRQLVEALVTGPASLFERALALVLLQTATDAEVGQMIVGGGLAGVLDAAFPAGEGPAGRLRDDLQRFYEQRFGVGQQEAVAAGTAPPLEVYPAGVFSPGQVEERLTSQLLAAGLTPDQARAALYNRRDASLKQLPADPRQIPAPPASYDARQAPTGPVLTGNSADLMSGLDQVPSAGAEIVGLL